MLGLALFILALAAFAFVSVRFGVDSRPESTDPRSPAQPVGIS
ncbi:MAG TPA: hypothetical protein VGM28_06490 [Candidatus Limnocylindrales bacterium]|jgi:hypothetical protein